MDILAFFIAVIALIIAVMALQKVGGLGDLKKQTEVLTQIGDAIIKATNSLREKTADVLDKLEAGLRSRDQKAGAKKEAKEGGEEKDIPKV
jgi:uncharacterized protein YoxC